MFPLVRSFVRLNCLLAWSLWVLNIVASWKWEWKWEWNISSSAHDGMGWGIVLFPYFVARKERKEILIRDSFISNLVSTSK